MKRNLIFFLAAVLWFANAAAQPVTGLINTPHMTINTVVRSDTQTVIGIQARPYPNRDFTVGSDSYLVCGTQRYPIRAVRGHKLDSSLVRGTAASFELVFGPLPAAARSVDMVVSPGQGNYRIWDIDLTGEQRFVSLLPPQAAGYIPDTDRDLPEPVFRMDSTTVTLHLLGLEPGYRHAAPTILHIHPFTGNATQIEPLPASGPNAPGETSYTYRFRQYATGGLMVLVESRWMFHLFTDPGETATVYLDVRALNYKRYKIPGGQALPYLYFTGRHAGLNHEHNHTEMIVKGHQFNPFILAQPIVIGSETTPVQFMDSVTELYAEHRRWIDASETLSPMLKQFQQAHLSVTALQTINEMPAIFRSRLGRECVLDLGQAPEVFRYAARLGADNPHTIYSYDFPIAYPELGKCAIAAGTEEYLSEDAAPGGYLWLAINAFPLIGHAERMEPLTPSQTADLEQLSGYYRSVYQTIESEVREAYQKTMASQAFELMETPDTPPEEILEAIIRAHPGKTILFDFWATWCGPCMQAMRLMCPLKPEMKEHGIEVIYVTDEGSPKTKWALMLPEIGGKHYYLTTEQWKVVSERYGVRAIPAYLLFDKTGELIRQYRGFPGVETLKSDLESIW